MDEEKIKKYGVAPDKEGKRRKRFVLLYRPTGYDFEACDARARLGRMRRGRHIGVPGWGEWW